MPIIQSFPDFIWKSVLVTNMKYIPIQEALIFPCILCYYTAVFDDWPSFQKAVMARPGDNQDSIGS